MSVRLAVAGAGLIGKRHVEAIARHAGCELAGIADPVVAGSELAAQHDCAHYETLDELIAQQKPDGLIIATPNHVHVENGLACIRAGIPVLIEKPLADKASEAAVLVEEAEVLSVPMLVGHHRRYNPLIRYAHQQIRDGVIGDIVAVHANCWLYKPDDYFNVDWRTKPGAGPVFINLIHDIDLMRYLVGDITLVHARESRITRSNEVEDTAVILLEFASGALGTVSVSDTIVSPLSWELTAAENPVYPVTDQSCYVIGGTHGSLDVPSGRVWSQNGERSWWQPINQTVPDIDQADPLDVQIAHFCDVIAKAAEPVVPGREGLKSLQVIEAVKSSAQKGTSVSLKTG